MFKDRLLAHVRDIRAYNDTSVADHFNYDCPNDYGIPSMRAYPIELVPDQGNYRKNKKKLLSRETFWIKELNTLDPHGINRKIAEQRNINVSMTYNKTGMKAISIIREWFSNLQEKTSQGFQQNRISLLIQTQQKYCRTFSSCKIVSFLHTIFHNYFHILCQCMDKSTQIIPQ